MPAPAPPSAAEPTRRMILGCAALLTIAALAAYHNSFRVPFLFDDTPSILDNPSIRHLWPLSDVLSPSGGYGITVSGRPVLNLSLALSYALSGTNVWGYHALNLLIHILAGLTLFGVVRRTLVLIGSRVQGARGREEGGQTSQIAGYMSVAGQLNGQGPSTVDLRPRPLPLASWRLALGDGETVSIAFAVALLWTLHPLQTEAVTYLIQRTESLMGLFFLLTLYCFIRAAEGTRDPKTKGPADQRTHADGPERSLQPGAGRTGIPSSLGPLVPWSFGPFLWSALSVFSCLLGMGTKEVTAVAPVLVFLYDRTFVAGSFREAWRRRRWLHLGLAATWLPLLYWLSTTGWNRGGTAGFDVGVSPWAYWFTQFEAVVRYLRQTVWPHPLVFEYGTFWMGLRDAAPYALVVLPLVALTIWAICKKPHSGFLGAWFIAILAPTSLVPGTIQMIVEHRMYLPLAAVLALVVVPAVHRLGRPAFAALLATAVALGGLTEQRNAVYRSERALWEQTLAHSPGSAIAQSSVGTALYHQGHIREALHHYLVSLRLDPKYPMVHYNLGLAYAAMGHLPQALSEYQEAVRINPRFYPAHFELGLTFGLLGKPQEALTHFEEVTRLMPSMPEAQFELGHTLFNLGRVAEAIPHYREALRLKPDYAGAECALGIALFNTDQVAEATECFARALRIDPKFADAHFNLGLAFARIGQPDRALTEYAEAVRLDPTHVAAQLNLGIALAQAGRTAEALPHLEQAVALDPRFPDAHCNLGIVLAEAGRPEAAVAQYEEALRLRPDYAHAHYNLGNALITLRRYAEAKKHFQEAVRLDPHFDAAREMLERLNAVPPPP